MRPVDLPPPERFEHGTRSRYVVGCRCDPCRAANRDHYRSRVKAVQAARADVAVNATPVTVTISRSWNGIARQLKVKGCPGVNGKPCVKPGTWLRVGTACSPCVDRAAVWNGLVPTGPALRHLRKLSKKGIGYKAVAAASDVGVTTICNILGGKTPKIMARVERAILRVDEGARADHSNIDSARSMSMLGKLQARGFSQRWIAKALGYHGQATQFVHDSGKISALNAAKIERLYRRIKTQKIEPPPFKNRLPAGPTQKLLRELLEEGYTKLRLSAEVGVTINSRVLVQPFVRVSTAQAVSRFHRQVNAEGDARPVGATHPAQREEAA